MIFLLAAACRSAGSSKASIFKRSSCPGYSQPVELNFQKAVSEQVKRRPSIYELQDYILLSPIPWAMVSECV
jgi:hypothetical protein